MHEVANYILPGELVFDIGANLGEKSEWFAGREMRVVSVEPQPRLASQLRERFKSRPNVTIVPKGLSDRPGTLTMHISPNHVLSTFAPDDWKAGRFKNENWPEEVPVEVTTLDALIREHGVPRYTKIDVEGFERQVVSGLSQKIGIISYEFSCEYIGHSKEVAARLSSLGYSHFNVSLGEHENWALPWGDRDALFDRMKPMLENDKFLWGDIYAL